MDRNGTGHLGQAAMTATPAYRPSTVKRTRRTRDQIAQLDLQIFDALREDHPQSVRHVFYRMTDPRLREPVEKSDRGYRQVLYRVLALRRARVVPYRWISDATRRGHFVDTFANKGEFLSRVAGLYRADLWALAERYCEVWTESRSIAGMIEALCNELAVSLYPCGGFSSETLAYQAAEFINSREENKPVTIFYIGDYDPAGVLIDRDVEKKLRTHLSPDVHMTFCRLGITAAQIYALDLPTKPRKETDRRSLHIKATVEAEAMPARLMRAIVREAVEALLPPGALVAAKAAEQSEREFLHRLAGAVSTVAPA